MAKSIRIQPTISLVAHQHLQAAMDAGETLSGVINRLLIHQLPKPNKAAAEHHAPVAQLRRHEKRILDVLKPLNEKIADNTITYFERENWYESVLALAQVRTELGTETRSIDSIMLAHYKRESDQLHNEYIRDVELLESPNIRPEIVPEINRRMEERMARSMAIKKIIYMYEKRINEANNQE